VVRYARRAALARAAEMLARTRLPVRDVALRTGYRSVPRFCHAFRKVQGASPAAYRRSLGSRREVGAPHAIIRDDFGSKRENEWTSIEGTWERTQAGVVGFGRKDLVLRLDQDLPDGILLDCDVRVEVVPGRDTPQTGFSFSSEGWPCSLRIILSSLPAWSYVASPAGFLDYARGGPIAGRWHRVRLRLDAERVSVSLDNRDLLDHSFFFPVPAVDRRRIALAGYYARVSYRNLRVYPMPCAGGDTPEAIADSRAADGRHNEAVDGYLKAIGDPAAWARISVKAARCCREIDLPALEYRWLRRCHACVSRHPAIAAAELRMADLKGEDAFHGLLAKYLARPADRKAAVLVGRREMAKASQEGRYGSAYSLADLLERFGRRSPRPEEFSAMRLEVLLQLRRFEEAVRAADLLAGPDVRETRLQTDLLLKKAYALAMAGRTREAMRITDDIVRQDADGQAAPLAGSTGAAILRSRGDEAEAEKALEAAEKRADWHEGRDFALFNRTMLLALRGEFDRAHRELGRASTIASTYMLYGSAFVCVIAGDCRGAAERIEREVGTGRFAIADVVRARFVAALLRLLTGEGTRAEMDEAARGLPRAFPLREAALFYAGAIDRMEFERALSRLPLSGRVPTRTTLVYLEGLRLEKAGDCEEASRYYRWAVREDPSRDWPTVLAERRLREGA
jgi:tetratricopeptide (TPR) repeat protein